MSKVNVSHLNVTNIYIYYPNRLLNILQNGRFSVPVELPENPRYDEVSSHCPRARRTLLAGWHAMFHCLSDRS